MSSYNPRPSAGRNTKRDGTIFQAANVNTGSTAKTGGNRNRFMLGGNADKNCALCTAAGVVNLGMGTNVWTSGMVAQALGVSDDKDGMGSDIDFQVTNIIGFCKPFSRSSNVRQLGSKKDPVSLLAAQEFMSQFPDGTAFAVYIAGDKQGKDKTLVVERGKEAANRASHWLNAVKEDGKVRFVDFQSDHVDRDGRPAQSDVPILGITGQTVPNPEMVVMAFTGTPAEAAAAADSSASSAASAAAAVLPTQ